MSPVDYLEKLQVASPGLAEDAADMANLYQRKLWHQLTLKVEDCFSKPDWNQGSLPLDLYNNVIADFGYKISLLKLSQFAVHVSKHISDPAQTLAFLQSVSEKLKEQKLQWSEQPLLFLKMHIAQQQLEMGQVQDCKVTVEEAKSELDALADVDPSVSAAVYYVSSLYYKVKKDYAEFYKASMMYLAFISSDSLAYDFKLPLAVDIGLAALLGEGIYNFAQLLMHPIVEVRQHKLCVGSWSQGKERDRPRVLHATHQQAASATTPYSGDDLQKEGCVCGDTLHACVHPPPTVHQHRQHPTLQGMGVHMTVCLVPVCLSFMCAPLQRCWTTAPSSGCMKCWRCSTGVTCTPMMRCAPSMRQCSTASQHWWSTSGACGKRWGGKAWLVCMLYAVCYLAAVLHAALCQPYSAAACFCCELCGAHPPSPETEPYSVVCCHLAFPPTLSPAPFPPEQVTISCLINQISDLPPEHRRIPLSTIAGA